MPLHDVKCPKCGHIREIFFQPTNRPNQVICPKCNITSKFKPLLGTPIINMNDRPVERQLERDAGDGIF